VRSNTPPGAPAGFAHRRVTRGFLGPLVVAALATVLAAVRVEAQAPELRGALDDVRRVTLDEALALVDLHPELRRARAAAAVADGSAVQSGAYPNPTFGLTHESVGDSGVSASESYFTLAQRLEWPAVRSARQEAFAESARAEVARVAVDSLRIAFDVKRAYVEAQRAERNTDLLRRVATVFRDAADRAGVRFTEGDLSLYDLRRLELEEVRYETLLAEAALELSSTRRALAVLVAPEAPGLQVAPAAPLAGAPPEVALDGLERAALERRGEIAALAADSRSAEARVAEVRAMRFPELTATSGFKSQSDGFGGVFLGLSVPLPVWNRSGGSIAAANARVDLDQARLASVRRDVEADARTALDVYRSQLARAAFLEGSEAVTTDFLEIASVAYEAGEMDLIELLDAAEALRDTEGATIRIQSEVWIAYYDLERAVGGFQAATQTEDGL
jgi:cobalt-zinc-cadmium efflux system outer membrane protein